MAIPLRPISLVRFHWKLNHLKPPLPEVPKPYTMRVAAENELAEAQRVVHASYNLDHEWSGAGTYINEVVLPGLKKVFANEANCLFVLHGKRIIAASAYAAEPEDGIHLVTGPCVLIEYRSRGIGGALLGATLNALRGGGLKEAVGQTRPLSPASNYLCGKFGGLPLENPKGSSPPPTKESAAAA